MRGDWGYCGVSANEYSCAHGAQINFEDLTPYYIPSATILDNLDETWYDCYANGCSGLQPVETSVLFGDLVGAADVVIYPEVGLLQTHLENFTEVSPPPPPNTISININYMHLWFIQPCA
jgi:hypothetical protein